MNRPWTAVAVGVGLLALSAGVAMGQGMLVPSDTTLPPLAIKSQQVEIAIDNQVATTTVKQVFMNSTGRQLEANYVFPLPGDATIRDFAMMVDGKRKSGELVEAVRAKQIYTQIVAQARDPGLLEHLGDNLFRVNIFPVPANGTQTVELAYTQLVPGTGGVFRYTYPLRTGSKASQVQDFFSVGAKLSSNVPIKSIYSPTHEVGISRKDDNHASVGLEQNRAVLDRDFSLYWTVSKDDFGLNAVSYRPNPDDEGYLMLLLSPKSAVNQDEVIAKDVQFVFDVSGSMSGDKIEQAKKALKYCIENLNPKDRFNIITFSTDVTPYKDSLIEASKENKQAVRDYINRLQAEGGTNIYDALAKSLETAKAARAGDGTAHRPQVIVFLTDGRPTIGKISQEEILSVVGVKGGKLPSLPSGPDAKPVDEKSDAKDAIRVFTFGVGDDVNTHLLDRIAQATGGSPEYVRTGEDIEVKVTDFFAKASHPVMTNLKLAFEGSAKVSQMLPGALPDLYFGQQVVAFARYSGSGDVSVTLSGNVSNGKTEKHTYELTLAKQTADNNFIEPLWAHRKVGYLLDQIRLNGESTEVKDEVIRLSKKYKIQTPYTSYLVLEEQHRRQYLGSEVAATPPAAMPVMPGSGAGTSPSMSAVRAPLAPPAGPSGDTGRESRTGRDPRRSGEDLSMPAKAAEPGDLAPLPALTPAERPRTEATPDSAKVASKPGPADESAEGGKDGKDREKLRALMDKSGAIHGQSGGAAGGGAGGAVSRDDMDRRVATGGRAGRYAYAATPASQPEGRMERKFDVGDLRAESGEAAVALARDIAQKKQANQISAGQGSQAGQPDNAEGGGVSKTAAGRTFYSINGFWVDDKFAPTTKLTFVKWGSEAYFAIVSAHVELKEAFALGTQLILVTVDGQKAVVISDTEGEAKMTEARVKELFTAAAPAAPKTEKK